MRLLSKRGEEGKGRLTRGICARPASTHLHLRRVHTLTGVRSIAASSNVPLARMYRRSSLLQPRRPSPSRGPSAADPVDPRARTLPSSPSSCNWQQLVSAIAAATAAPRRPRDNGSLTCPHLPFSRCTGSPRKRGGLSPITHFQRSTRFPG